MELVNDCPQELELAPLELSIVVSQSCRNLGERVQQYSCLVLFFLFSILAQ